MSELLRVEICLAGARVQARLQLLFGAWIARFRWSASRREGPKTDGRGIRPMILNELNKCRGMLEAKQLELSAGLRKRQDINVEKAF
jgi:hypothetical protein